MTKILQRQGKFTVWTDLLAICTKHLPDYLYGYLSSGASRDEDDCSRFSSFRKKFGNLKMRLFYG